MNLEGKDRLPVQGAEDPALPWPDCSAADMPAAPGPGPEPLPTPEVPDTTPPGQGNTLPNDSIDPRLLALAMAFVPRQSWETPYDFDVALQRGTIFPALDKPFLGEEALPE